MNDRLPRPAGRAGRLALAHHHGDLAAQMLLVEAEGFFAIPAEIQLGIELHFTQLVALGLHNAPIAHQIDAAAHARREAPPQLRSPFLRTRSPPPRMRTT